MKYYANIQYIKGRLQAQVFDLDPDAPVFPSRLEMEDKDFEDITVDEVISQARMAWQNFRCRETLHTIRVMINTPSGESVLDHITTLWRRARTYMPQFYGSKEAV